MLRFLVVISSILACSIAAIPAEAAVTPQTTHHAAHHKAVAKKTIKAKHKVKANPQRIISTIRSDKAYHTRLTAVSQNDSSESVFTSTSGLQLASTKALIVNQDTGETLYAKSTDTPTPIASVTKLMTAMVMLDMHLPMDEPVSVSDNDVDTLKNSTSRLRVGTTLPRGDMLQLALMSSENRAASALARTTPIGTIAFVAAMNRKALELGMTQSHFADPTGLNSENVATAEDLVKMVKAAYQYPEIRKCSTSQSLDVPVHGQRQLVEFRNTNILVRKPEAAWDIGLSKTGYISEAGRCLVMQAKIGEQPLIIVLLDSYGKLSRIADAQRIRKWIASAS
ncbi:MAG TPA: D-alanyl-D-alanine endopeptidase [Methylophilaceae bacterium]